MRRIDSDNAHLHQTGFIAGFYIQPMRLETGKPSEWHEHRTAHVANVLQAPLLIEYVDGDGVLQQIDVQVPCRVPIAAGRKHRFTAGKVPAVWECWFPDEEKAFG